MVGPVLKRVRINGYRSVGPDGVDLSVPIGSPLVLVGENNAGKSNILRAIDLLLGDFWPSSHKSEDHEHFGRNSASMPIEIRLDFSGLNFGVGTTPVTCLRWAYDEETDPFCSFTAELDNGNAYNVNGVTRDRFFSVYVSNDRDLKYQLSYNSKYTALSKLMRSFHKQLTNDTDRVTRLKDFTQSLIAEFDGVSEFNDFKSNLLEFTNTLGGNLPYGLGFDFSAYDPSNFFRSLRLLPHLDGSPKNFEELGTGQGQVLSMAFLWAYARAFKESSIVLLLEEPESHLHPLAQQWLAEKLAESAKSGVQIILTTHSPYFINLTNTESMVIVEKHDASSSSQVTQLSSQNLVSECISRGAPENIVRSDNIGVFYEISSTPQTKSALFAPSVVLIEGSTEQYALPILLKDAGLDLIRSNISLVPVDGASNIAKWVRYYLAYGKRVYVIFDTDSNHVGKDLIATRKKQKEILESLSLDSTKTIQDYSNGAIGIHEKFATFDCNFETALGYLFGEEYRQLDQKSIEIFGRSKPTRARYVANELVRSRSSFPNQWSILESLATSIESACRVSLH